MGHEEAFLGSTGMQLHRRNYWPDCFPRVWGWRFRTNKIALAHIALVTIILPRFDRMITLANCGNIPIFPDEKNLTTSPPLPQLSAFTPTSPRQSVNYRCAAKNGNTTLKSISFIWGRERGRKNGMGKRKWREEGNKTERDKNLEKGEFFSTASSFY